MKKLLTACLPALALFALGGCAGTSALTSSEDDGVYYSSRDRTTAVVSTAPTSTNEAANPDYNGNTNGSTARQGTGSAEYYDDSYTYMQGVRPGVGYYTPYSPYTSLNIGYGMGGYGGYGMGGYGGYGMGGYGGFSPYGAGFYDPFYSPFGYGYGSGLSIGFGFGQPWGYGGYYGYGQPFGRYGNGFGNGFYDPYFHGGPFYGGYYGRGFGGQGGYYGNNNYRNNGGYYGDNNGRGRASGSRTYRSSDGRYQSGERTSGAISGGSPGGGRVRPDGLLSPSAPQNIPTSSEIRATTVDGGRTRTGGAAAVPGTRQDRMDDSFNQPRNIDVTGQPRYRNMDQQPRQQIDVMPGQNEVGRDQGQGMREQPTRDDSRSPVGRWRNADAVQQTDQMQPAAEPQENQRGRRGRFSQDAMGQPRSESVQPMPERTRQRAYDQPRQQRVFEQRQPERTYEQPQQRNFDQPQRSYSQPSSAPSGGGGGGGGRSRGRTD